MKVHRSSSFEDEDDDDDDYEEPPHTSILVLGRTNTGKSSLVRNLLAEFKDYRKPVAILNFRPTKKNPKTPYEEISWNQLRLLEDSSLIVEDLIQVNKSQYESLSLLLNNWVSHHRLSPTICIAQQIHRQGIHGLLAAFSRIYMTAAKANIYTWQKLLSYYAFDEQERANHLQAFRTCQIPFSVFYLDVEDLTINRVNFPLLPEDTSSQEEEGVSGRRKKKITMSAREILATQKAQRYLGVLPNSKEAMAIWDMLFYKLKKTKIDPNTLEITLQQKGHPVVVSLVDYIASLVDTRKNKLPAGRLLYKFHKFAQSVYGVTLPRHFVLNTDFY